MPASLYIDNDVICRLASLDLLTEAMATLGVTSERVRVLETAKYSLGHPSLGDKKRKKFDAANGPLAYDRVHRFLAVHAVVGDINIDDHEALHGHDDINDGEAVLASCASRDPGSLILTSDKRFIRALADVPSAKAVASRLLGRIMCFEQLLGSMFAIHGFEFVRARVVTAQCADVTLRMFFSSGEKTTLSHATDGIDSHVRALRAEAKGLLCD